MGGWKALDYGKQLLGHTLAKGPQEELNGDFEIDGMAIQRILRALLSLPFHQKSWFYMNPETS